MSLIAKKPCSFGGRQFYIGDEIPADFVADAKRQEQLGVIAIVDGDAGDVFRSSNENTVPIPIELETDGENAQYMSVMATPEEIQQTFSIMQLTAEESIKAISDVTSENILILLHAADSRKKVKTAAKERAENIFSIDSDSNEARACNEPTGMDSEGAGM